MNRFLLDTNILIFLLGDKSEISTDVKSILDDYNNHLEASSIAFAELVQLYRIGKIKLKRGQTIESVLDSLTHEIGISVAGFSEKHVYAMSNLDVIDGHNDPFDHAIIAHAITDRYTLISSDSKFKHYRDQNLNFVFNKR